MGISLREMGKRRGKGKTFKNGEEGDSCPNPIMSVGLFLLPPLKGGTMRRGLKYFFSLRATYGPFSERGREGKK